MAIKDLMFDEKSEKSRMFFTKMLCFLDSPKRLKYNNPDRILGGSGIKPGQTVLEIGCGSGFFTAPASKMLGNEGKLFSIDIHPIAVNETKQKVEKLGLTNVTVKKDDAMNSSFEDNMFDVVLLYGVVPAPVISMNEISKEIHRILKPNGVCAVWTMVPFWTPYHTLRHAGFKKLKKVNGVFRVQKYTKVIKD
jgi:demethylmenaquinone methyltransferase/2-methoxy-6-polyprenyl-1,4-benzoquinol methylase